MTLKEQLSQVQVVGLQKKRRSSSISSSPSVTKKLKSRLNFLPADEVTFIVCARCVHLYAYYLFRLIIRVIKFFNKEIQPVDLLVILHYLLYFSL